jgi:hypothetical protein
LKYWPLSRAEYQQVNPERLEFMPRSLPSFCLVFFLFAGNDADAQDIRSLDTVRWLLGNWVQENERVSTRETWREVDRGTFKGRGIQKDTATGAKQSEESLLLTEMSGEIYYFAKVGHNKYPVPFELTSCSATHAIFENTEHDFPKKLEYRLVKNDSLNVTVSDGGARSFTFRFKKQPSVKPAKE